MNHIAIVCIVYKGEHMKHFRKGNNDKDKKEEKKRTMNTLEMTMKA